MEEKKIIFNVCSTNASANTEARKSTQNTLEIIVKRDGNSVNFSANIQGEPPYEYPMIEQCIAILRSELKKYQSYKKNQLFEIDAKSWY